jgi:hypothetical protein
MQFDNTAEQQRLLAATCTAGMHISACHVQQ